MRTAKINLLKKIKKLNKKTWHTLICICDLILVRNAQIKKYKVNTSGDKRKE